ncbi:MAG: hypothetical protein RLZZ76_458 [Candidatus Parcubacteria bacterium]|jgi:tRNA-specific 2-thiouridylase
MEQTHKQKTVFVGLSGGVDSSVAALRLKKQGYFVVGVFIKVWHPDFLPCNWEAERLDAMRVAAKLDIPFLTCDGEAAYKQAVADYFIGEYKAGRTPNPDVMCNKYVKFGVFLKFAKERGADFVATGHYAQVEHSGTRHVLKRGVDGSKDQSYFLWTLTEEQLAMTLLPVGDTKKVDIRKEAEQAGLLTAEKKDSQGICFLGHVDIPDFLSHYVTLEEGEVIDEHGEVVGTHKGALVYTVGQRQGLTFTSKDSEREPKYVVRRDIAQNIVYVSTTKPEAHISDALVLTDINYIAWKPAVGDRLEVETRYRQKPVACELTSVAENRLGLKYLAQGEAVSEGQSCVLFTGDTCLGGGIITL